jgi:glycosyltransferase involved in cell wall biosynthesis
VDVHRLLPGPNSSWNEVHFQKNVCQWIDKRSKEFDCVYVDRSDGLLSAVASRAAKWNLPIIARFAPEDTGFGISQSQRLQQVAMVESCRRCARVVCPTQHAQRVIVSRGMAHHRVNHIPDPAWERIERSDTLKAMATQSLFDTCSDFVVPGRSSVVLHLGVSELKPLRNTIQSLCDILDFGAMLRVWIVGCGLPAASIYDLIKSRGWHREILVFDSFDDIQELVRVADLAIVSNPIEASQFSLPVLAQAGVPLVIAENAECRSWIPEPYHFLFCSNTVSGFSERIQDWITNRERWSASAWELRSLLRRQNSCDEVIHQWLAMVRDTCNEIAT